MGTISIDIGKKTDESLVIHAFSTATEEKWKYSIDGGGWKNAETENSSTATIFIDGLNPNTEYEIGVRTNILNAKYIKVTTLYPLSVYSPSDVYIDSKNPQLTFTANIPTGFFNDNLTTVYIRRVNEQMGTAFGVFLKNGKNSIEFVNPDIIDEMLRTMSKSKDMVFTAQFTYSKNSEIYSTSFTFHCKTSTENSAPILTDFVYKDGNTGLVNSVTGSDQILIQNQSGLVVNITPAEPRNHAIISAYTVTVGNVSVSTTEERVPLGRIDLSGAVPIVVTAIDSRGYTATLTKIVEFIPYKDIEITELTIDRINSVDETVYLRLKSAITPIYINGENRNGLGEIRYQTMRTNGEEVSELSEITSRIDEADAEITVKIDEWLTFNEKNSYYIYLYVSDKLTKDEETVTLKNGRPVMSFRKEKVGINNNDPQYALDIVGDLNLTGRILINGEEIDLGGITE